MMTSKTRATVLALAAAGCAMPAPGWAAPAHRRTAPPPIVAISTPPPVARVPFRGLVHAQDPQSLVRALQSGGYKAALGVDKVGDPMITSEYSGTSFQIFFYNCTNHVQCATVQFHSGYDFTTPLPLDTINEWNRSERFGRAYLDKENDPILEMDVDLDDGGLSPALFIDNVEFWTTILGKFEKHIGYRK